MSCLHRQDHFSPRRSPHSCVDQGNGASPLRIAPVISAPPRHPARNNTGGDASISASPSKFDVFFAATVFAAFALIAICFYGVGALLEWIVLRGIAARRWIMLRRVCSWCRQDMGGNPLARTTHGICPHCLAEQKRQMTAFTRTATN